ncbi:MAG: APC family permease [Alphaproteobacteria bacterium]|nr:APC family permease [Alphaproteobacteria bacterium]
MAELKRGIGRADFMALVVNAVVGAGVLALPGRLYAEVGSWSLVVIAGTTLLVTVFALCTAELAGRFDRTGGPGLYATEAFGPTAGFSAGWLLWIARTLSCATQLGLLVEYASGPVPWLATAEGRATAIVALGGGLGALTWAGVVLSARASTAFTVLKLAFFAGFVALCFAAIDFGRIAPAPPPPALGAQGEAVILILFAFFGFEAATVLAGETRDPKRTVPAGLIGGIAIIALIYGAVSVAAIGVLPDPATAERAVAAAAGAVAGAPGDLLATFGAIVVLGGALIAGFLLASRMLFAMAESGQLPAALARIDPRRQTPDLAVILVSIAITLMAVFSSVLTALVLSTAARLLVGIVTYSAMLKLRARGPSRFVAPAGGLLAVVAVVLSVAILAIAALDQLPLAAAALVAGLIPYALTRWAAARSYARSRRRT